MSSSFQWPARGRWLAASLAAVAISVLVGLPAQVSGKPIVCAPPQPDPCREKSDCVTIDDEWQVVVEPTGEIYLNDINVSRTKLKEYAVAWAKEGTWPIVVRGHPGTEYAQIRSIVALLEGAGVKTRVSCVAP